MWLSSSLKMASMKKAARMVAPRVDVNAGSVLELSITVGYLGGDVKEHEIDLLHKFLVEHCTSGLAAMERGETESHLHFQMVARVRCSFAQSCGVMIRRAMNWFGKKRMLPMGKVTCKVLTQRQLHTFTGMLGYCLKDSGRTQFKVVTHNISTEEIQEGISLHKLFGRADLKRKVTLTNKNILERIYVWYMYKTVRPLSCTFLSLLTEMIQSGGYIPSVAWIIPLNGQGMDHCRMSCLWKCLNDPPGVTKDDIRAIFIKKRDYVAGRYFEDEETYKEQTEGEPLKETSLPFSIGTPSTMRIQTPLCASSAKSFVKRRLCFRDTTKSQQEKEDLPAYISLLKRQPMIDAEYFDVIDDADAGGGVGTGKEDGAADQVGSQAMDPILLFSDEEDLVPDGTKDPEVVDLCTVKDVGGDQSLVLDDDMIATIRLAKDVKARDIL